MLGLSAEASREEIKVAYREMAQILHPDKYSENKKLADRAQEQFKRLNEARDLLLGRGGAQTTPAERRSAASAATAAAGDAAADPDPTVAVLKARLVGIAAAREQLNAQLDSDLDYRRIAIGLIIGGLLGFFVGERFGMRIIDALGATALVWGVIQLFSVQPRIRALNSHLQKLNQQRREIEAQLHKL